MDQSDYINKYFEGTLSEAELNDFNTLLLNDTNLKKEFAFQKELQETLVLNDREQVKKEIQSWDTEAKKFRFKPWQIAASIVVLLGLSLLYFNSISISNDKLYATYHEPYRNVVQPIVRGENKEDLLTKAFTAYENKEYKNAITYFDEILKLGSNETISFYKANALMEGNKTKDAIMILEVNVKNADTLQGRNLWYLALAYLKENNTEDSKKALKQLLSQSEFKTKEAKKLLEELD